MTPPVSLHSQETGLLARETLFTFRSSIRKHIFATAFGGNLWPEKDNSKSSDTMPSGNALLYFLADCDER